MGSRNTVGNSDRTPAKHALLRRIVGREFAVAGRHHRNHKFYLPSRWSYLDLTVGNSCDPEDSSYGIVCDMICRGENRGDNIKHLRRIIGIERVEKSFLEIKEDWQNRWSQTSFADKCLFFHGDARKLSIEKGFEDLFGNDTNAAFVNNDPNSICGFAITEELMRKKPKFLTTFSTLGCNVGGMLGAFPIDAEEGRCRLDWAKHIKLVLDSMLQGQDALLVELLNDAHKWAYLITGPSIWKESYERDVEATFGEKSPYEYDSFWWKEDEEEFMRCVNRLILTKEEFDVLG